MTTGTVTMTNEPKQVQTLNTPMWWVMFILTTVLLSSTVEQFKVFTLTPTGVSGLKCFFMVLALLLVLMVMMYDSYVKEKLKGTIARPIKMFERLYALQVKETSNETSNNTGNDTDGGSQ